MYAMWGVNSITPGVPSQVNSININICSINKIGIKSIKLGLPSQVKSIDINSITTGVPLQVYSININCIFSTSH